MWKLIEGFSIYEVNKSGEIRNKKTLRVIKFNWRGSRGGKYPYVNLKKR